VHAPTAGQAERGQRTAAHLAPPSLHRLSPAGSAGLGAGAHLGARVGALVVLGAVQHAGGSGKVGARSGLGLGRRSGLRVIGVVVGGLPRQGWRTGRAGRVAGRAGFGGEGRGGRFGGFLGGLGGSPWR